MKKISSLILGAGLALSTIGLAYADPSVTGTWKLSVGYNDDPCTLTLADAGDVTSAPNCDLGLSSVSHWKASHSGLELYSASGDLVAMLKPSGNSYTGTRLTDGRRIALDR